jgi:hypothetical protein
LQQLVLWSTVRLRVQVQLAVIVLVAFMVTVVFMALALATLPFQLFQVLQLALNEAFTVSTVFCGILVKVFVVPAETVPLALTWPLTVTLQQLVVWFTVRLYVGVGGTVVSILARRQALHP